MRRLGSNIISTFIKLFTGKKIKDPTSGFRATNKNVIKVFAQDYPTEYPEPESTVFLIRNKFKIKEIPVEMHERQFGQSSIKLFKSIYYMFSVSLSICITSVTRRKIK